MCVCVCVSTCLCVFFNVILISAEILFKWIFYLQFEQHSLYAHFFPSYVLHASHNILISIRKRENFVSSTYHKASHLSNSTRSVLPHTAHLNLRIFWGIILQSLYI
jgi:hypothetical protein